MAGGKRIDHRRLSLRMFRKAADPSRNSFLGHEATMLSSGVGNAAGRVGAIPVEREL